MELALFFFCLIKKILYIMYKIYKENFTYKIQYSPLQMLTSVVII